MKITEEMIRALQAKVDISYEEAERYLQKAKGDVDVAYLLYKEKQNSFSERASSGISGFLQYRFRIVRKGRTLIDLPIAIILLVMLLDGIWNRAYVLIFLFIIALVVECEFKIDKEPIDEEDWYIGPKKQKHTSDQTHQKAAPESETSDQEVVIMGAETPDTSSIIIEADVKDDAVEFNNQEGYNEKDKDKHDDQDDYYEIVIEE